MGKINELCQGQCEIWTETLKSIRNKVSLDSMIAKLFHIFARNKD